MRFFKVFLASLLAFIVFTIICFLVLTVMIGRALTSEKVNISPNGVLVLETGQAYKEQKLVNPIGALLRDEPGEVPGLYQTIRLIGNAATDDNIKGIYLKVNGNPNGFASTEELRDALLRFRRSGKFVVAYGEVMEQSAYYLATAADKVYLNPKGAVDFTGFSSQLTFLKGTLEKLEIKPEIFYCGKFKSATEPLRETQMTEANRVQTTQFLGELYSNFLTGVGKARHIDTATLHGYANENLIQEPADALKYKLVDGLKYDDEIVAELQGKTGIKPDEKVNLVSLGKYNNGTTLSDGSGDNKIALIYAQGDIVGGEFERDNIIASENYIREIRKARQDKDVKAILFRVNSGGGSALASEVIWRELSLAKKVKPVVVSMGDYAASGGYYISCMADSIFAEPNTLTGSIGVFGVMFNMQDFFKNKLGVTFDGVKTAQYADLGSVGRPLTEGEKRFIQNGVDSTYASFKSRVVAGRKLDAAIVDSIAQGRVWSGLEAQKLGLVDRIGGITEALACAARLAKLSEYRLREYPEVKDPVSKLMKTVGADVSTHMVKKELGVNYELYQQIKDMQAMHGDIQARMPFKYSF
ncbi:signal peptide peptidase SppA [Chitinophaga polysaccharea]|uniref:signal peptide peptidase SppA n=1 Tax=Chitinophaga polysaccharea TaxID=1293035 RepID=UPI001455DB71|nr:signal peptide peptidase SppA [Chitinophaga polysaccharea]NLR58746.1 signal peptide peptidase SppA [Chitinophaga polysaccharea]